MSIRTIPKPRIRMMPPEVLESLRAESKMTLAELNEEIARLEHNIDVLKGKKMSDKAKMPSLRFNQTRLQRLKSRKMMMEKTEENKK